MNRIFKTLALASMMLGLLSVSRVEAQSEYELVARNFLSYIDSTKDILHSRIIEGNSLATDQTPVEMACLVSLKEGGYILISPSRELTPIKAYSTKSDFETLPGPYQSYLLLEMEYNARTRAHFTRTPSVISETHKRWDFLLGYDQIRTPLAYTPGEFLITSRWNQGHPYNRYLPELNGQKVPAGCVNVALAQVMKYHGYPSRGRGVVSYTWNDQQPKAILYRPFNWANMPNELTGTEPDYHIDEVALLIRDLAIMNETQFSFTSSPTSSNIQRLIHFFGYSYHVQRMDNSDEGLFFQTLKNEIDAERPILLSFPGHMTVADGYVEDDTGNKIHVNMGWGGHHDDFYYLDKDAEGITINDQISFAPELQMIYGLRPCSGEDCAGNLEEHDTINGANISGRFDFPYDADEYQLYLKGDTVLTGDRGYSNQAFYITVYDSHNAVIASDNKPLSLTDLPPGLYRLWISLVSGSGVQYPWDDQRDYTVTVNTESLTAGEKAAVDAALDIPPVIFNDFQPVLLNTSSPDPLLMLIDARDQNGHALELYAARSNPAALEVSLNNNILSLLPVPDSNGKSATVKITATSNGLTTEKTFVAMVLGEEVGLGKNYEVKGIFESQTDFNAHKVILDGSCTISGYRGFLNQAFFTSVLSEEEETIVEPVDSEIEGNFPRGIYYIGASPAENPEGYGIIYDYTEGENDKYVLTIRCPNADDSVTATAATLNIDLSGTELPFIVPGDINGDGLTNLIDAILVWQILAGLTPSGIRDGHALADADINADAKIGLEEAIYILQYIAIVR